MQDESKAEFTARVERIRAGGAGTNRTLYVGMEDAVAIPKGFCPPKSRKGKARAGRLRLVVLVAGVIGVLCFGALQSGLPVAELMQPLAERLAAV